QRERAAPSLRKAGRSLRDGDRPRPRRVEGERPRPARPDDHPKGHARTRQEARTALRRLALVAAVSFVAACGPKTPAAQEPEDVAVGRVDAGAGAVETKPSPDAGPAKREDPA